MINKFNDHFILIDKCAEQTRIVEILNHKIVKFIAWFDTTPPLIGSVYDAIIIKKLNGGVVRAKIKDKRILSVREMILSKTKEDRAKALVKLLPHQKKDFMEIFKIMNGLPVTVRLLDPPLHEFLPNNDKEILEVANVVGVDLKEVKSRISELHEQNPMLGHRGCRLGISYPEIYEMQCRAIFEALVELKKNKVKLYLMVSNIDKKKELLN